MSGKDVKAHSLLRLRRPRLFKCIGCGCIAVLSLALSLCISPSAQRLKWVKTTQTLSWSLLEWTTDLARVSGQRSLGIARSNAHARRTSSLPSCIERPHATNYKPLYAESDAHLHAEWSKRIQRECKGLPRVLVYTWLMPEAVEVFANQHYWKQCYAHAHGFDIVFSSGKNLTGVKEWPGVERDGYVRKQMWAWVQDVQQYLLSGEYDYVFVTSPHSLFLEKHLDFPVWAWDSGHDITMTDQHSFNAGSQWKSYNDGNQFNMNSLLLKPTLFTRHWLEHLFEYRKTGFHLQIDMTPAMENVLVFLGREAEAEGRGGYRHECLPFMTLPRPQGAMGDESALKLRNIMYEDCFFDFLDRLAGPYGYRRSKNIGFSPSYIAKREAMLLPSDFANSALAERPIAPWFNCFSMVMLFWLHPEENCFLYIYDNASLTQMDADEWIHMRDHRQVKGMCPDPAFKLAQRPLTVKSLEPYKSHNEAFKATGCPGEIPNHLSDYWQSQIPSSSLADAYAYCMVAKTGKFQIQSQIDVCCGTGISCKPANCTLQTFLSRKP